MSELTRGLGSTVCTPSWRNTGDRPTQADAVEQALLSALPMEAQAPAGGISVPEAFTGELTVTLERGRNLPVWGFPWQSNPYCRIELGCQAVQSKRDDATGQDGTHRNPVWNQEFQFLVEDPQVQELVLEIRDSQYTGASAERWFVFWDTLQ